MRTPPARAVSVAVCLLTLAAGTPAVALAAGSERQDQIVMLGNLAGEQQVSTGSDGVTPAGTH
jgi:hypothetical protein